VARGGAQALFNIDPDLTTLGKIIGGGLPVGAFGGRSEIMNLIAPEGPVYQAGTLSGNPLAMVAGTAMLEALDEPTFYQKLGAATRQLADGLAQLARRHNIPVVVTHVCGMFSLFFTSQSAIYNLDDVAASDVPRFNRFFHAMLARGVYLAPSAFEAGFVSAAHGEPEISRTLQAADAAFGEISAP
jgi:glutamate-1-semialdehyde 2,1-aminomutase